MRQAKAQLLNSCSKVRSINQFINSSISKFISGSQNHRYDRWLFIRSLCRSPKTVLPPPPTQPVCRALFSGCDRMVLRRVVVLIVVLSIVEIEGRHTTASYFGSITFHVIPAGANKKKGKHLRAQTQKY